MWNGIKKLLGGAKASEPMDPMLEARLFAATLMVEAALADGIYADIESAQIREIIRASFGMEPSAARRLLDEAETLAEQAVDHHRFTNVVKRLPLEEREALVENLWKVVFADGEEAPEEQAIVRKLTDLLHVDPRASRLARLKIVGDA